MQHGANLYAFTNTCSIAYKKGITQRVHVDINDYKDDKDRMITAIAKMLQIKRIVKKTYCSATHECL